MVKKDQNKFDFEQLIVDVTTALPLDKEQSDKIIELISSALNVKNVLLNVKIDKQILGGFQLQIGSSFMDFSVKKKLSQVQKTLDEIGLKKMTPERFETLLQDWDKQKKLSSTVQKVGRVISVKDGIVRVKGMKDVKSSELIEFENGIEGIVFTLNTEYADVVLLSSCQNLKEGNLAFQTGRVVQVPVGKQMIGRVVNALGLPIDGAGEIKTQQFMPLEAPVPGIIDRQPVFKPFQTGLKVIDALVPIGLGQRELIVGDRQTGKTSVIIDAILNQKHLNDSAKTEKEKISVFACRFFCF